MASNPPAAVAITYSTLSYLVLSILVNDNTKGPSDGGSYSDQATPYRFDLYHSFAILLILSYLEFA